MGEAPEVPAPAAPEQELVALFRTEAALKEATAVLRKLATGEGDDEILLARIDSVLSLVRVSQPDSGGETATDAQALCTQVDAARKNKDFKESDRIRDALVAMGVAIKDGKDADGKPVTTWEIA